MLTHHIQYRAHEPEVWNQAWEDRKLVSYVYSCVKKHYPWITLDDVFSAGIEGLCRAREYFDPARAGAWKSYAFLTVRQMMIREIRAISCIVCVPEDNEHGPNLVRCLDPSELDAVVLPTDHVDDNASDARDRLVDFAVSHLPKKRRRTVELLFGVGREGQSHTVEDAAREMSSTTDRVRWNLADAMKTLRCDLAATIGHI